MSRKQGETGGANCFSHEFWADAWKKLRAGSFLQKSQEEHPGRWQAFYDATAALWPKIAGCGDGDGDFLANCLMARGMVKEGERLLEVGCGAGGLAVSLAGAGVSVTALDSSREMIGILKAKSELACLSNLCAVHAGWESFSPASLFDAAAASCFPQAMCPEGVGRLESFSRKTCVLIIGSGTEPFPVRRLLWDRLVCEPFPVPGNQLVCAVNWLLASGRFCELAHFRRPVCINATFDDFYGFYKHYFGMFGVDETRVLRELSDVLAPFEGEGGYVLSGFRQWTVISWKKPGVYGCAPYSEP